MKRRALLLTLLLLVLVSADVWAMASPSYRLDWFTALATGGGGPASSTNYRTNLTVGQGGFGTAASPSYQASLGYWAGATRRGYPMYLPLITH